MKKYFHEMNEGEVGVIDNTDNPHRSMYVGYDGKKVIREGNKIWLVDRSDGWSFSQYCKEIFHQVIITPKEDVVPMHKLTVENVTQEKVVSLKDMKVGEAGYIVEPKTSDSVGQLVVKTYSNVVCLGDFGNTWLSNETIVKVKLVKIKELKVVLE